LSEIKLSSDLKEFSLDTICGGTDIDVKISCGKIG
jgi:hypothetical protein